MNLSVMLLTSTHLLYQYQEFNSGVYVDTRAVMKSYRGTDVVRVVVWTSILTVTSFYHTMHVHVPIQSSNL